MSELAHWLERLEEQLLLQGARTLDCASPGLSEDEAVQTLADAGLPAPPEVVTWWGWRNGSVRDGSGQQREDASIGPLFLHPTLAESITYRVSERARMLAMGNSEEQADLVWHRSWLLLARRREPLAVVVEPHGPTCPVVTADPFGTVASADSVAGAVQVWVRALEERWWLWDDHWGDGRWRYDLERIPPEVSRRRVA